MSRLSRRRFLLDAGRALGLGGAAAATGCKPGTDGLTSLLSRAGLLRTDRYTAAFVGQSFERGHRLRDGSAPAAIAETKSADVVIVGAGVAGLAAAHALSRAGVEDYRIFDLEDEPGGNSRAGTIMGIDCPWGAHYLPVPGPAADEVAGLLAEFGSRRFEGGRVSYDERQLCQSPQERLFIDGHWQEGVVPQVGQSAATFSEYARFADAVQRLRKPELFAIPTSATRWNAELAALDAQSFGRWLDAAGFVSPALRWYLDYCCRDDYGAGIAHVSAWAGLHYFASRHGFRVPGAPAEEGDDLLTWPEGNAWLSRRLAAPHRERTDTAALALRIDETRHEVLVDVLDVKRNRVVRWRARRAIVATPLFVAARLLADPPDALRAAAARIPHAPWLVANLYIDAPLRQRHSEAPLSWDNVIFGGAGLGYVDASHQNLLPYEAATVLTYYLSLGDDPAAGRKQLLERDLSGWCQAVLADLETAHPDLRAKVRHIGIMRYGHGMAIPVPGARSDPSLAALHEPLSRIQLAHSDLSAYSIFEEAYHWGRHAGTATAAALRKR